MINIPAVSVIIPMYNAEKYIRECLESIFAQTFQDYEVIVVDDCSTDNSCAIAESYSEKFGGRLKIFHMEKNSGVSASRNKGLSISRGEYIFFMDADDMFAPNALEEMHVLTKKFVDADVISFTIRCETSEDGKEMTFAETSVKPMVPEGKILIDDGEKLFTVDYDNPQLTEKVDITGETYGYRAEILTQQPFRREVWLKLSKRDFLIENNIFFHENIRYCEDHVWTYAIFLLAKKIIHVPRVICYHRKSLNSLVRTKRTSLQRITVFLSVLTYGIKQIDNIMNKIDFFKINPEIHYSVCEFFIQRYFSFFLSASFKCKQHEIYKAVKQEFGEKLSQWDILIVGLITFANSKQKKAYRFWKKLNAK